jgi:phosphate transport system substrate-binding protein
LKGKTLSSLTFVADLRNRQHRNKKQTDLSHLHVVIISAILVIFLTGCTSLGSTTSPTLSGHLLIAGSTALQPLVASAAESYQRQHPQVKIDVEGGGSVTGLTTVTSYKANIGDSDIYADPAQYPDPNLTDHIVCVIPFTMIVNLDVPVSTLTQQQIIDIFSTGKIHNWSQVGGPNLAIVPVVRPTTSGTRATFRKYILGGRDENGRLQKTDSSTSLLDAVAHTPGAISYLALSVADASVHEIAINNKMATPENIANGSYAFWSYEHMYTMGDNNALLSSFLDFMLTQEIQSLAQNMHYIPIANMNLSTADGPNTTITTTSSTSAALRESEVSYRES